MRRMGEGSMIVCARILFGGAKRRQCDFFNGSYLVTIIVNLEDHKSSSAVMRSKKTALNTDIWVLIIILTSVNILEHSALFNLNLNR